MVQLVMEYTHRILVVETDDDLRFLWRAALSKLPGVEVETVAYAHHALDRVRVEAFDLVVIDLWLPRTDGMELTRALHAFDDTIPILWITEHDEIDQMPAYRDLGIAGYVDKPVTIQRLRSVVLAILAEQDVEGERSNVITPGERVRIFPVRTKA